MKVVLLNGSPHEKGCTYTALREIEKELQKNEIETEIIQLGTKPIQGCIACGRCLKTGRCFVDDKVNLVLEKLSEIDGFVFGSLVSTLGFVILLWQAVKTLILIIKITISATTFFFIAASP
jgi:multimeric flavodoxin WrbA